MWTLQAEADGERGAVTFRVMRDGMKTLGRAIRADFIVDAPLVSRLHCRFTAQPSGDLEVEDLRSTNVTFVNDKRIKRALLQAGDRVRVGRVELTVTRGKAGA
jgi:pSer/pThr/pTyr-binding forkhead associated (FHA) protein